MDVFKLINPDSLPLIVGIFVALLVFVLCVLILMLVKSRRKRKAADRLLDEICTDDFQDDDDDTALTKSRRRSIFKKWNDFWYRAAKDASIAKYENDHSRAGRDAAIYLFILAVVVGVLTRSIVFGVLVPVLIGLIVAAVLRTKVRREEEKLNNQLPGFLYALKAKIQAGDTNEKALLEVTDTMSEPLKSELDAAKNRILSGSTFNEAMQELKSKTSSRDLAFLCACMIQATQSGASINAQIDNILRVIEARQRNINEIKRAVKAVTPAIYISAIVIPAVFIFMYFYSDAAREFWFHGILSWALFILVFVLFAIGLFLVKRSVDKIKNL